MIHRPPFDLPVIRKFSNVATHANVNPKKLIT